MISTDVANGFPPMAGKAMSDTYIQYGNVMLEATRSVLNVVGTEVSTRDITSRVLTQVNHTLVRERAVRAVRALPHIVAILSCLAAMTIFAVPAQAAAPFPNCPAYGIIDTHGVGVPDGTYSTAGLAFIDGH